MQHWKAASRAWSSTQGCKLSLIHIFDGAYNFRVGTECKQYRYVCGKGRQGQCRGLTGRRRGKPSVDNNNAAVYSTFANINSIAFGIGTSEVEMVLASQCILQSRPKTMRITVDGELEIGRAHV